MEAEIEIIGDGRHSKSTKIYRGTICEVADQVRCDLLSVAADEEKTFGCQLFSTQIHRLTYLTDSCRIISKREEDVEFLLGFRSALRMLINNT